MVVKHGKKLLGYTIGKILPFKSRVYRDQVRQNDDFRTMQSPRQDI